jgi:hypothetical protein
VLYSFSNIVMNGGMVRFEVYKIRALYTEEKFQLMCYVCVRARKGCNFFLSYGTMRINVAHRRKCLNLSMYGTYRHSHALPARSYQQSLRVREYTETRTVLLYGRSVEKCCPILCQDEEIERATRIKNVIVHAALRFYTVLCI